MYRNLNQPRSPEPPYQAPGTTVPPTQNGQYVPTPVPPSTAITWWITAAFGPFGLIPASIDSNRAARIGSPSKPYWQAFGIMVAVWVFVAAVITVAGFSGENTTRDASEKTVSVSSDSSQSLADPSVPEMNSTNAAELEQSYLDELSAAGVVWDSDSTMVADGWAVCKIFDAGYSAAEAIQSIRNVGQVYKADDAYYVVKAAVHYICPEHAGLVQ